MWRPISSEFGLPEVSRTVISPKQPDSELPARRLIQRARIPAEASIRVAILSALNRAGPVNGSSSTPMVTARLLNGWAQSNAGRIRIEMSFVIASFLSS